MEEEEDDDECIPEEKKECPKVDYLCPPRDIDPCSLDEKAHKKAKKKGSIVECGQEKTCADVPPTPDPKERLMREHLELLKALNADKPPTCRQTASKKSKDPC